MNSLRRPLHPLARCLALVSLAVQAGIDRALGQPLPLALGVDAPVTAATAQASAGETPAVEAPAAEAPAAPSGLKGALAAAFSSLRSKATIAAELSAAQQQVGTLTTERDQARSDLAARTTERDQATAQLHAFAAFFGFTAAELAGKTSAECTQLLTHKISAAAIEQVAALNFNKSAQPLPTPSNPDAKNALEMSYEQFNALSPAEKMEFSVKGGRIA